MPSRAWMGSRPTGTLIEIEPLGDLYSASSRTFSPLAYLCAAALMVGFVGGMATGLNLPKSPGRGNAAPASPHAVVRLSAPLPHASPADIVVGQVDASIDVQLEPNMAAPGADTPIVNDYTGFVTGSGTTAGPGAPASPVAGPTGPTSIGRQ